MESHSGALGAHHRGTINRRPGTRGRDEGGRRPISVSGRCQLSQPCAKLPRPHNPIKTKTGSTRDYGGHTFLLPEALAWSRNVSRRSSHQPLAANAAAHTSDLVGCGPDHAPPSHHTHRFPCSTGRALKPPCPSKTSPHVLPVPVKPVHTSSLSQ